jgi:two-component system response regulator HydG
MKTVLIVDADPEASGTGPLLRRRGFLTRSARNGRDALAIVRQDPALDLVVTEMQLSDMDGLHFLMAVRALAPLLPIIVVTGSGSIENYLHAVNLGVYEYLSKPVLPKELLRIAGIALSSPGPVPRVPRAS